MNRSNEISAPVDSRGSILTPLAIALASRFGLILLAYLGLALFEGTHNRQTTEPGNLFLDGWMRWDAHWYARIAEQGYTNQPIDASGQRDTGDLPLFPLAVRTANYLLHDVYLAGFLVSNFCFIAAAVFLYRLVAKAFDESIATRTLVLLCVYPFSYTYTAMYSESLFLLCAVASFWFGETRRWPAAALFAAAAGATRVAGIASAIALIVIYMREIDWTWKKIRRDALWLPVGFFGLGAFVLFLWARFDDPLAFVRVHSASGWGDFNSFQSFRETIRSFSRASFGQIASGNIGIMLGSNLITITIAIVLCVIGFFRLPVAYSTWAAIVVVMSIYRWGCFNRHFATVFPAFIVAAILLKDRRLYHGVVYICTLLLALFTLLFTHSFWVA